MVKTTEEIEAMNRFNNLDRKKWYSEEEAKEMQKEIVELKQQLSKLTQQLEKLAKITVDDSAKQDVRDLFNEEIEKALKKQAEEIWEDFEDKYGKENLRISFDGKGRKVE